MLVLALGVLASAQTAAPQGWSGPVVRVADRSGWDETVYLAVQQWNAAGVGIELELVPAGAPADVHVVSDPERLRRYCAERGCEAFSSTTGPNASRRTDIVLDTPAAYQRSNPIATDVRLLVHELGHALGLRHAHAEEEQCAVMLPDVALLGCGARGGRSGGGDPQLCGPFPADVRKAAQMYGGAGTARPRCITQLGR